MEPAASQRSSPERTNDCPSQLTKRRHAQHPPPGPPRHSQESSQDHQSVWWPGLSANISQEVKNCPTCTKHRTTQREPLLTTPVPERLWQCVGTEIFTGDKNTYLVAVDYFSWYIEVAHLNVATANAVIAAQKNIFGRNGVPELLMSNNGPQYACALFKDFASEYGFTHITSSRVSSGNCQRLLWKKGGDYAKALLSYQAAPLENGYFPVQLLTGRQIRTPLPQVPKALSPHWPNIKQFCKMETQGKRKPVQLYNKRHRACHQPNCTQVRACGSPQTTPMGQSHSPKRSYLIRTDEGLLRRTCTHLRATHQPSSAAEAQAPDGSDSGSADCNTGDTHTHTHTTRTPQHTASVTRSGRLSHPPKRMDM